MKDLKYIKLFEAFESTKINKTLSFLNKNAKSTFLTKLKKICSSIDLPESKLSDSLFEYLPYAKAIKYNGNTSPLIDCTNDCDNGKVTKKWGKGTRVIDCSTCKGTGKVVKKSKKLSLVKFWFNKDGEFLSVTGVDGEYRPGNIAVDGQTSMFSTNLDDYDVAERVAKTRMGELLNTGDVVKLTLIDRSWRTPGDKPNVVAFILKHGGKLYAIQDTWGYSRDYIDSSYYQNIGRSRWQMTSGSIRDIFKLKLKVASNNNVEDPMGFNTQVDDDLRVKSMGIRDSIKNANFAIVLDLNKLGDIEFDKKTDIISNRKELKKDALALMNDEDIKNINLKKYFDELNKRSKLVGSIEDLALFSRIIVRLLGGKYSVYNLCYNSGDYLSNNISTAIATGIFKMIKSIKSKQQDGDDVLEEYLKSDEFKTIVNSINSTYEQGLSYMSDKNKSYIQYLTNMKNEMKNDAKVETIKKILGLIDILSVEINKLLRNMPCECLEDIEIILQEVGNIRRMLGEREYVSHLASFFSSMNSGSWSSGNNYYNINRNSTYYNNSINGLNQLIKIVKRKQEIYKK